MTGTYFDEDIGQYVIQYQYIQEGINYDKFRATFCAAWLGAMIAVGIAFFTFSTSLSKEQIKSKLFQVQSASVILAILYDAMETGRLIYSTIFTWNKADQKMNYTLYSILLNLGYSLDHLIPLLADSTLIFRLSTFFPFPIFSKRARFYILSPFIFIILIRFLLSLLIGGSQVYQSFYKVEYVSDDPFPFAEDPEWTYFIFNIASGVENGLASIYCIVVSSILLYKAHKLSKDRLSANNKKQMKAKLRFFSEAITMCFVPPIFLNIAAVIQLNGPWGASYAYFRETETANVNLSVIFSLLASSWNTIRILQSSNKDSETKENSVSIQAVE